MRNELLLISIYEVLKAEFKHSKRVSKFAQWILDEFVSEAGKRGCDVDEMIDIMRNNVRMRSSLTK